MIHMMGLELSVDTDFMVGLSASTGRSLTCWSLLLTSIMAMFLSMPQSNSRVTTLRPCWLVDVIFFSPSTVSSCSSMRLVMFRSTSLGDSPRYSVRTSMMGLSTVGVNWRGRRVKQRIPTAAARTTITVTVW